MVCVLPVIISAIENPKDRDLMTEFYLTQNTRMYAEAWKYLSTPEDVEDIVYEALTRIIEKIETFRSLLPPQRLQYAVTTVRNLSYIYTTRKNLHPTVPFEEICFELTTDSEDSPEALVEKRVFFKHLRDVWQEIKTEERMLLEQKYILRWTDEEIAEKLCIKSQSVRMRMTRAKRSVLKELQKNGFDLAQWK
ncbi:MAG: sigma-70 family RNA polymerase sigma factor [Ruminococcaceae bacterium]|nr:sigma-70 family RNA polymerase sigma factor [Oscillospiraceae bacterium]